HELLDLAAMALEDRAQIPEGPRQPYPHDLRIGGLPARGGADEVAEEDGDDLALLAHGEESRSLSSPEGPAARRTRARQRRRFPSARRAHVPARRQSPPHPLAPHSPAPRRAPREHLPSAEGGRAARREQ